VSAVAVPPVGTEVVDAVTGKRAIVRDFHQGRVYLQKPGGGVKWTRRPQDVTPVIWGYCETCGAWAQGAFVRMISETSDEITGHDDCPGQRPPASQRPRHYQRAH